MATKFLLLSLLSRNRRDTDMLSSFRRVVPLRLRNASTLFWIVRHRELHLTLLYRSLEAVLTELETLLIRRDRREWAATCFALCLIFFAAEIMQVNVHVRHPSDKGSSMCEAIKMNSVLPLKDLFSASTAGFHPLDLDWDLAKNAALVDKTIRSLTRCKVYRN